MNCPECGTDTQVIDSRLSEGKLTSRSLLGPLLGPVDTHTQSVRRRRKCPNGHRFSTYEAIVDEGLIVQFRHLESKMEAVIKLLLSRVAKSQADEWEALRAILGCTRGQLADAASISQGSADKILSQGLGYSDQMAERIHAALRGLAKKALEETATTDWQPTNGDLVER